ncbi:sigma-70 family RNA polymerase sigma factor [Opitutaceae bacterium]
MSELPDDADVQALQRGEKAALDRLMNRWQVPLRAYLYRHLRDEQDALDLAQETFVRVYRNRDQFRPGARFSTWMFQIALNLVRDHMRRRQRRPTDHLDAAPEPLSDTTTHSDVERSESMAAVREAIAALPEDLREAVILSEYEQLSHAEIGQVVGATPKAVETRLYRARDLLRKRLQRWLKS